MSRNVPRSTWLATVAASIGVLVWLTGVHLAVVAFDSHNAVPYSRWNHVISELGFPFVSPLTWVYNGTLAASSLLLLPTFYALSTHLRTGLGYVAAGFGTISCLALSGVGIFGLRQDIFYSSYIFMRFYRIHMALAGVCYLGWLAAMTLFAIQSLRRWKDPATRAIAIAGILCCLVYPAFFIAVRSSDPMQAALAKDLRNPAFKASLNSPGSVNILTQWLDLYRPHIWWPAALEWVWAWSMLLWLGAALVFLWTRRSATAD